MVGLAPLQNPPASGDLRRGIALAVGTALISGVSVYVSKFGTQAVPDPFVYTTARNVYVGALLLALLGILALRRRFSPAALGTRAAARATREPLTWRDWLRLALIAIVGGSVPFLLFFWGLTQTSAPMASFIQKTQFLWVAAMVIPFVGESFGLWQAVAVLALSIGTLILGPVQFRSMGTGEILVLVATLLWSAETVLARATLRRVSPLAGAAARMAGGAVVMLGFLAVSGRLPALVSLTATQWLWVAGPGLFLFGYVASWYYALRHAPALVVTSILTLGAPVTALLNGAVVSHMLPVPAVMGGLVLAAGAACLTFGVWRATRASRTSCTPPLQQRSMAGAA
jgi:drug/metabolite transporter (DMT)-like permease